MEHFFRWLLAPLWAIMFGRSDATRQATLLWTLVVAVEKQFPLSKFLETLAYEAGGSWRWKVRGLAELISAGTAIPDALEAMPGVLPSETVAMIRIGAQSGNLSGALREAARVARRRGDEPAPHILWTLVYMAAVVLGLSAAVTYIMIQIIPKYKAIFGSFDVKLPALTRAVIHFGDNFAAYWYLGFPLIVLAILGFWSVMSVGLELMGLGPVWGKPRWLSSKLWPRLKAPQVLRCLSVAVEGNRPLPEALQLLADREPDVPFRHGLLDVAGEVTRGENCWIALRGARMLKLGEPVLLEAAERVGNLVWALRGMADSIERRAEYRYHLILELIDPVLVLCVGAAVGTFCISLFLPLLELLQTIS